MCIGEKEILKLSSWAIMGLLKNCNVQDVEDGLGLALENRDY